MITAESLTRQEDYLRRATFFVFAVGFFACVLVFVPTTILPAQRFTQPKELALFIFSLLTTLLCFARAPILRFDYADAGIAVLIILGLVSTYTEAQNPWLAWRALGISIAGALVFWSTRFMSAAGDRDEVLLVIVLGLGCLALVCLLEAYGLLPRVSLQGRAPGGTLGNRNHAAHLLVIVIPVQFWCVMRVRRFALFGTLLLCIAVGSAALVVTRSRAAWIAAIAVCVFLIFATRLGSGPTRITQKRAALFAGAVFAGAMLAFVVPDALSWRTSKLDSLQSILQTNEGSGRGRLTLHENTLRMATDHPLLGVGPGNWTVQYPRYASIGDPSYNPQSLHPTDTIPQGDWVGLLAERGVPALVALGIAVAMLLIGAWSELRTGNDTESYLRAVVIFGIVLTTTLLGMMDAVLLMPAGTFVVAAAMGAAAPLGTRLFQVRPCTRWVYMVAICAALMVATIQGIKRFWAGSLMVHPTPDHLARSVRIDRGNHDARVYLALYWIRRGKCDQAIPLLQEALRLFPTVLPPRHLLSGCEAAVKRSSSF